MLLTEEIIYRTENSATVAQNTIILNHIYHHYVVHNSKDNEFNPASTTVKIQELPGTRNIFIANTIRNIDINLNLMFCIIHLF